VRRDQVQRRIVAMRRGTEAMRIKGLVRHALGRGR
jgi:hypothetical protein